jgi:hypothetical protein
MHITILETVAILCQRIECEQPALYLFRGGMIEAYCESHAQAQADRLGIALPLPLEPTKISSGGPAMKRSTIE